MLYIVYNPVELGFWYYQTKYDSTGDLNSPNLATCVREASVHSGNDDEFGYGAGHVGSSRAGLGGRLRAAPILQHKQTTYSIFEQH